MSAKKRRLPHTGAAALFHEVPGAARLTESLAYQFRDLGLLQVALTHPTASARQNNQRLEFLGDAVLELVISHALFDQRQGGEGKLTFARQKLVNEETLADIARGIHLGGSLILGAAFRREGGASQPSVLADAMEALIAAVYLDGGLEAAQALVLRLWAPHIAQADAALDSKGALQAWYQARGLGEPRYEDLKAEGPPHQRVFTVGVYLGDEQLAKSSGRTKRLAQQQAAGVALKVLRDRGEQP